ncbi:serine hydrolase [Pseudarthrobacter sp. NIBRBAC000502770]|uniref:serine hydrolase domain-containing protein n=1 Tax=Pseudarthrobacter sp. NIBRBAC000502770 TaxID=2590785 RepID=UPI00113FCA0F|nr:serine hydrolase domain-containing protein [Pseudarthrobacter sp. NIBRBAC000502770]QDG89337.1 beta-lactamase family protein [Pseudarthrobacter sp. NIBRBAC000502770]
MSTNRPVWRRAVFAAVLAVTGCTYTPDEPVPSPSSPNPFGSLENQVKLFMNDGAVATVVQVKWPGGEWSKAFGMRDLETRTPAQPTGRVQIASVTKTMTAVAVLKLVDDHLIGLDDPVNDVIPGFTALKPPGPITVRQLLSHTSGMPEANDALPRDVDFRPSVSRTMTMERGLQLAGTLPWDGSSVGSFRYSNTNYLALGLLIQELRHKPFTSVMREEIFGPLGLKSTTLDHLDPLESGLLHGYVTLRGERIDTTDNIFSAGSPAVGAVSTVEDMNHFMAALFQGRAISAASLGAMTAKTVFSPYGLGLWEHADGCSPQPRYAGRGLFWDYQTVAVSSSDGRYQASMTVTTPPLPTELEDESTQNMRELLVGQIESTLNEALDRLCAPAK